MKRVTLIAAISFVVLAWTHGSPGGAGFLLLADNSSFLLLVDAASKVCLAGGC